MRRVPVPILAYFAVMAALPLFMGASGLFYDAFQAIFVFSLVGLGLNVVTGFTGLLNLGMAAFMAIGAYTFAILTSDIYPFQIGFWWGILATVAIGAVAGFLLGAPTLGLSGDYLAIVTMGFGEITLDVLKNLDAVTKGTQGINPLPRPTFGSWSLDLQEERGWYWLLLGFVLLAVLAVRRLERSRSGRAWLSIREDALASQCMGIPPKRTKMIAFATGSALAALGGTRELRLPSLDPRAVHRDCRRHGERRGHARWCGRDGGHELAGPGQARGLGGRGRCGQCLERAGEPQQLEVPDLRPRADSGRSPEA